MAQCVKLLQNPDGSLQILPDSQTDLNQCAYVIQSGAEIGNLPTYLTPSQGLEIGAYVAWLWALAWGIRQVANALNSGNENETE